MSNNNRGFTIIEVVASLAILSIISGVLLQMFVVSAKVDRKAFDIDRANLIAGKIAEEFKQSPVSVSDSVYYYDFNWKETQIDNTINPPKFKVAIKPTITPTSSTQETCYPGSVIGTIDLIPSDYKLSVVSSGEAINVALNPVDTNLKYTVIDKSKITPDKAIPIVVNYNWDSSIKIQVDNKVPDYEARIYLLMGGGKVSIDPIDGKSGLVDVGAGVQGFSDGTIIVTATRLDDNLTLSEYNVKTYFPQ